MTISLNGHGSTQQWLYFNGNRIIFESCSELENEGANENIILFGFILSVNNHPQRRVL